MRGLWSSAFEQPKSWKDPVEVFFFAVQLLLPWKFIHVLDGAIHLMFVRKELLPDQCSKDKAISVGWEYSDE
jgi:hypothetical protein